MVIRSATPGDVEAVLPLVGAICALHEAKDPQRFAVREDVLERYRQWLPLRAEDPRSVFLVAVDEDGRVFGYVVGTVEPEVPIFWVPECGWIHDVYVDPGRRGGGVGLRLVQDAVERFRGMGVAQVRLHTGAFNEDARRLFAKAGFRVSVIEMLRPLA
jgi:GNAT superfamily N-acetyltransferase